VTTPSSGGLAGRALIRRLVVMMTCMTEEKSDGTLQGKSHRRKNSMAGGAAVINNTPQFEEGKCLWDSIHRVYGLLGITRRLLRTEAGTDLDVSGSSGRVCGSCVFG
jgi:hypothetical protein